MRPVSDGELLLKDLSTTLFASLPRRDQRHKGEQYLRGLLAAQGRRSIRNIAACLGDPALDQSLHHFICSSTWDWMPMREALADWLEPNVRPQAWVVRQLSIPKSGRHSVGVGRGFDHHLDQEFHGQRAFGLWAASERASAPVNWRLLCADRPTADGGGPSPSAQPQRIGEPRYGETTDDCATAVALDFARLHDAARRPVVLDVPVEDPAGVIRRFDRAGVRALVRVAGTERLSVEDPTLPGHGLGALEARRILDSAGGLRRLVGWPDPTAPSGVRRASAAAVRVGLPGADPGLPGGRDSGLVLVGEWDDPRRRPTGLWLGNLAGAPASTLLRLTKLADRVGRDLAGFGDRAGLRDFEGRSLRGWHCHSTLASAAHAVEVLMAAHGETEDHAPKIPA
ncbi:IS701 family transposase [Kitasatospora sp. NPDC059722]|uniref:IS701 family transposase n=1 Tax=Kitasatospora sp. NPDC059722 TaxID=3346925 RepID=UPI0036B57D18